jgi:hypothetical protein
MSGHNSDLMDNSRASAIALNRLDYFCLFAASSIALVKGGAELFFGLCVFWLLALGKRIKCKLF